MCVLTSGVARAFPGGRVAHPESQNEEENEKSLRKNKKKMIKIWEKNKRTVELLPTRDCEAGYGPGFDQLESSILFSVDSLLGKKIHTLCSVSPRSHKHRA